VLVTLLAVAVCIASWNLHRPRASAIFDPAVYSVGRDDKQSPSPMGTEEGTVAGLVVLDNPPAGTYGRSVAEWPAPSPSQEGKLRLSAQRSS